MTVKLTDNVTDIKAGQYGMSSKIHSGSEQYFVNEDASYMKGRTVQLTPRKKLRSRAPSIKWRAMSR